MVTDTGTRPNVLVLLSDEHSYRNAGYVDADGAGEPARTPAIDGLAESGAVFEQTYCQSPVCGPSRQCLLTGLEQQRVGAWNNSSVLKPEHRTFPETFSAAGYETCLVGKMHLSGSRQFAGFGHRPYGDLTGLGGAQSEPLFGKQGVWTNVQHAGNSDEGPWNDPEFNQSRLTDVGPTEIPESLHQERRVVDETVAWLREFDHAHPDDPWLACASFIRPHFPLTAPRRHFDRYWPEGVTPPAVGYEGDTTDHPLTERAVETFQGQAIDEEERLRARAAYFACVDYLDELLDDLLRTLERDGLLDDTVVVYASDHGELAGEHGLWWKTTWHEASVRVPWVIELPEHRDGTLDSRRFSTPVSLVDLFPTLCGLADIDVPDGLDGVDLSGSIREGDEPDRGPVVSDYLDPRWGEGTEFRIVRDGRYKYVGFRDAPELLFDLVSDPLEQTNLAEDPGEHRDALVRLRSFVDDTVDFEAAEAQRERDATQPEEYPLGIPPGLGNVYHMPDGRLVNADATLYHPDVLTKTPEAVFDDWPGG